MLDENYQVVSVRPAEPPFDVEGSNWHSYVIVQGSNTIRGYRQGSLNSVKMAAKDLAFRLNERRSGKRGRVQIVIPAAQKSSSKR